MFSTNIFLEIYSFRILFYQTRGVYRVGAYTPDDVWKAGEKKIKVSAPVYINPLNAAQLNIHKIIKKLKTTV